LVNKLIIFLNGTNVIQSVIFDENPTRDLQAHSLKENFENAEHLQLKRGQSFYMVQQEEQLVVMTLDGVSSVLFVTDVHKETP
jgi:hypothetical protein